MSQQNLSTTHDEFGSTSLGTDAFAEIQLQGITKRFGDLVAVDDLDLTVRDGEFLVLLGPSGCGKSTTLRMIAGLEIPSEGSIRIGDDDVTETLPQKRNLSMVFQSYALYPHKTVRGNLEFPLEKLDLEADEMEEQIQRTATLLEIDDLLDNKPGQLSGGQRQRVALGRTIVREPQAFLMDEPLSNLDAKLRVQTRSELRRLQQQLGTTTIYVTHDQEEAMSLADRIAVMNDGRLQQVGTPKEVYENPVNEFVAGFLGEPSMNFLEPTQLDAVGSQSVPPKGTTVGIRPEAVTVLEERDQRGGELMADEQSGAAYQIEGEALVVEPLGNAYEIEFDCDGTTVTARLRNRPAQVASGSTATLQFSDDSVHLFGPDGEVIQE